MRRLSRTCSARASRRRARARGGGGAGRSDRRQRHGRWQYADVRLDTPPGLSALRRLHELKTGRLIGVSVLCVLLLGGLEMSRATIPFRRFAAELGVLFQIVDDILDVTGTDAALGKPQGSDERHGKRTYVSEFGIERARELAASPTGRRATRSPGRPSAPGSRGRQTSSSR